MVAFVGAKGGVGTTTLAVNTAAALAKTAGSPPLLIDLHLAHGDAALFLGAEPRFSVLDAFENLHKVDESFFAGLVEKTQCGAHVLASTARPVNVATSPTATRTLLELAARRYRITVLDVPRTDPAMLDALDPATVIVVVTSQEVSAVRSAAATAATLRQRYGRSALRVVINRFDKNGRSSAKDIEGGRRAGGIPDSERLPRGGRSRQHRPPARARKTASWRRRCAPRPPSSSTSARPRRAAGRQRARPPGLAPGVRT